MEEPELATIRITRGSDGEIQMQDAEVIPANEAWRIGLPADAVRWLLGIPDPPRKPPTYAALLQRCKQELCEFVPGVAAGWEVCRRHGLARKIN